MPVTMIASLRVFCCAAGCITEVEAMIYNCDLFVQPALPIAAMTLQHLPDQPAHHHHRIIHIIIPGFAETKTDIVGVFVA